MKRLRRGLYVLLGLWGFISFCILLGEENPDAPMTLTRFMVTKAGAFASLWLCYRAGKHFNNNGLLPEFKDPEQEEEEWED